MTAYILAAKRTPIGSFGGVLATCSPLTLGLACLNGLHQVYPWLKDHVDLLVCGQVLAAGHGQNLARQLLLETGCAQEAAAYTVNHVCGSGMQAIISGMQAIASGMADCVIAGGVESMSQAAFLLKKHRWGHKLGHQDILDSLLTDGLQDALSGEHMGITAETVAQRYGVDRHTQDTFALHSHQKASVARQQGRFEDEIIPIHVTKRHKKERINHDEGIREETSIAALSQLRPVFRANGTVTAGNASTLNDGAAFAILLSAKKAHELGIAAPWRIAQATQVGNDPAEMGMAPVGGIRALLNKTGYGISDIDCFEINEAFAAQAVAVQAQLGISPACVNPNGGAIALGHPIGASGARIVATLVAEMTRKRYTRGIASLCIGGGQATSILIEKNE